jgi:arylsulfatase
MREITKILLIMLVSSLVGQAAAYETDAPQQALAAKNQAKWSNEDEEINRRLAQIRKKNGRPNIILILTDDIGWGELGSYGGGKLRGTPTPNLDELAAQGMKLLQHYAEPSCTPTRVALMTGRLPIRTGLDEVLFPGQDKGLAAEEYTLAELLSDSGYQTAMFGKWHMGEKPEHQPTSQGFDYALYTMYNGGPWPWKENAQYYDATNETIGEVPYELDMPQDYEERFDIKLNGIMESRKGEKPHQIAELSLERYNVHENELTDGIISFIEQSSETDKPFFVYWASNANQVFFCPPEERTEQYVDSANCQASQLAQHDKNIKKILNKLEQLGIDDNTLLVWVSDNGPMYSFFPSAGFSYLRGHKHEVYEGGVRTPALVRWPGVIEAGSDPVDLVHVTDWYTTIARVANAGDHMPSKRIIDGVDQTSLLINGEGHSRRDYVLHYKYPFFGKRGAVLGAVRMGDIKLHLTQKPIEIYNIKRDPKEQFSSPSKYLWALLPFRRMVWEHEKLMEQYPNRILEETVGSKMKH